MTLVQRPLAGSGGHVLPVPNSNPETASRAQLAPNATLAARIDVTDSLAIFSVVLDEPLSGFRPGQYVSVGVFADGAFVQRPYSVVTLRGDGDRVELFIRRLATGAMTTLLWGLTPGSRIRLGPPRGLFVLDALDARPRLFIGTGTGLAPLLAMLDALVTHGDQSPNVLIHGVSYQGEFGYAARIGGWVNAGLDLWYVPTVSRPDDALNSAWSGTAGRADAVLAQVLEADPSLAGGVAYMCGNSNMIEACRETLLNAGLRREDVRAEQFHVAPVTQRV